MSYGSSDLLFLIVPGECPAAQPYAFNLGSQCCSSSKENSDGSGTLCDGSTIGYDSTCCQGTPVSCPDGKKCVTRSGKCITFIESLSSF